MFQQDVAVRGLSLGGEFHAFFRDVDLDEFTENCKIADDTREFTRRHPHTDVIVGFWDAEGIHADVHEFQSVLRDSVGTYTVVALPS